MDRLAVRLLIERYLTTVVGVAAGIATIVWMTRKGDLDSYVLVGNLVLSGGHIYADSPPALNTWPPFFSLFCVPLALLARPTPYLVRFVWLVMNLGLLWVVLRLIVRLVKHRPLHWHPSTTTLSLASPEVFLPLLLCLRFVLANFDHLQINVLTFALTLAGLYAHVRGHDLAGGAAIGAAAAMKVMPVIFIPYCWYRRRYRLAASATIATIVLSLSPAYAYGWPRFLDYAGWWWQKVDTGWGVSKMNQSVFAMFDRYLGHGVGSTLNVHKTLGESGELLPWLATYLTLGLIAAAALYLFRGDAERDSPASLAEYSVVFIVSAIFGPVSWKAYLVVLLLPCALLVDQLRTRALRGRPRAVVTAALAIYALLAAFPPTDLLPKHTATAVSMLSITTVGTLVLLATLLWLRPRLARTAAVTCELSDSR